MRNVNHAHNSFLEIFKRHYDTAFPKRKLRIKEKKLNSLWKTKVLQKLSKRKQELYDKHLKETNEAPKKKSKKLYYSKLVEKYKDTAKKHGKLWNK